MLSYRWGDMDPLTGRYPVQEKVKMLKLALEKRGHRVWMDVEQMRGAMDDVMYATVEQCAVFVACVTDAYHELVFVIDVESLLFLLSVIIWSIFWIIAMATESKDTVPLPGLFLK